MKKYKLLPIIFLFISFIYLSCKQENENSKIDTFSLKDFDAVVKMVKKNHIDKEHIDESKSYRGAAEYALLSLPQNLYIYPENYYKNLPKYETKEERIEGQVIQLNKKDKFIIFKPDYEKLKKKKKKENLSNEKIKELIEKEKKKKKILNSEWSKINFRKEDFYESSFFYPRKFRQI